MTPGTNKMFFRLGNELQNDGVDDFNVCEGRIQFIAGGTPDNDNLARHLAGHIKNNFSAAGVGDASASGATVRITMAGATYGSIVVKGTL